MSNSNYTQVASVYVRRITPEEYQQLRTRHDIHQRLSMNIQIRLFDSWNGNIDAATMVVTMNVDCDHDQTMTEIDKYLNDLQDGTETKSRV